MSQLATQLDQLLAQVLRDFQEKNAAREKALHNSREVVRHSANAIRAVHRGDMEAANTLINQAATLLREADEALLNHPDIYHAGFVHDAQKEYAEACITKAVVSEQPLPDPTTLSVPWAAYLNGAGEAVGELRRQVLDRLRLGETKRCEELLAAMDDIYAVLVAVDFPDAMTGGLRRTADSTRGILERTRGDLTVAIVQNSLQQRLENLNERLT